jgi:ribonucleoside-diphosphate reductase alpha chain
MMIMDEVTNDKATTTYTYEEAFKESVEYFRGDELAASVFISKYALRDDKGNILEKSPRQMHRRLAKEFARIEKKYANPLSEEEIFSYFDQFQWIIPQGSPMSAIGNDYQIQSCSNCFVVPSPEDSYGGILKTDQEQAQIMKRRGGVGFDISKIRPKGVETKNAARTTDGIGVFMDRFSNTCREVAQNGRRGALMLSISSHHPEIRTFINIKKDKKKVTGANISIRLSDEFMNAVKNSTNVELRWPVNSKTPKITALEDATAIWNEIIDAAWQSAEPGILFWDTAQKYTPSDIYKQYGYESISTNPCGEIILSAYDSCRLVCINLYSFVINPFTKNARFDFEKFEKIAEIAQRLMDDMIDIEIEQIDKIIAKIDSDPETEDAKYAERKMWHNIREACVNGRRTGLGITALGDAIAALGVRYGSKESIDITEAIYKTLAIGSYRSSCILAKERGPFPIWNAALEKGHPFLQRIWDAAPDVYELYQKYGRRNIANTTTAPVGSGSTLTQSTSGIESAFMVFYLRWKKINPNDQNTRVDRVDDMGDKWQAYPVFHHHFKTWMQVNGHTFDESKAAEYKSVDDLEFYKDSPYYKATANDVDWVASVDLQAAAQKWVCHAISKTCNVPNDCPKEVVAQVYMRAWEKGCKGFTVYREGCRDGVLVAVGTKKKETIQKTHAPKRPKALSCDIHHTKSRGEDFFVIVGLLDGNPYEVFAGRNGCITHAKKGTLLKHKRGHYVLEAEDGTTVENLCDLLTDEQAVITRLLSLSLRHGSDISYVVDQLEKSPGDMTNFGKAMARVLKKYIADGTKVSGYTCESCGSTEVIRQEGCMTCKGCGSSKCG